MFSFRCLQAAQLNRPSDEQKIPPPPVRHTGTVCPGLPFADLGSAPVDSHLLLGFCGSDSVGAKKLCD